MGGAGGAEAFLQGTNAEIGVRANGAFGSTGPVPSGFHGNTGTCLGFVASRNKNGWSGTGTQVDGDFFCPGSPFEGWFLNVGASKATNTNSSTTIAGTNGSIVTGSGTEGVTWTSTSPYNGISVSQVYSIPTAGQTLNIDITLTNTTGAPIANIVYGRIVDPDDQTQASDKFTSTNKVIGQGSSALVTSTFPNGALIAISSTDSRTTFAQGGNSTDPAAILAKTNGFNSTLNSQTVSDTWIGAAVNVGTLAAGASTTIHLGYALNASEVSTGQTVTAAPPPTAITVPVTLTTTTPTTTPGTSGSGASGLGTATAVISPAVIATAGNLNTASPITYTLSSPTATSGSVIPVGATTGSTTTTSNSVSSTAGTLLLNVKPSNPTATTGSSVAVSFDTSTGQFKLVSPVLTRPGARVNQTRTAKDAVIHAATTAPAAPIYQVTAPKVLALNSTATLVASDTSGNSVIVNIPITLYAPGEVADLVGISIDLYGNFGTAASSAPVFSRDGQVMSFASSDQNFAISGATGVNQAMRYAVSLATVDLMSQGTIMGTMNGSASYGGNSLSPALSADGKVLAFASDAQNIYPFYPAPKGRQIYLTPGNTALTGNTTPSPAPLALSGVSAIGSMDKPALNADGTIIAFESTYAWASSVATSARQIYVKNTLTGAYRLASSDLAGAPGNADSFNAAISDDGRFVLFEPDATNLGANPTARQVYLKDMTTGAITLISATASGVPGNAISTNAKLSGLVPYTGTGLSVAFESDATNLVSTVTTGRQIYRRDVTANATTLISINTSGQAVGGSNAGISGDGRFVVYKSTGANIVGAIAPSSAQIYVYDAVGNKAALVSADVNGLAGNAASDTPMISADGRSIGFTSLATNLDGTGNNGVTQAYIAANPLTQTIANGFWVNPNLPGQYYAVEQSGNKVWFAAFSYNANATSGWTFSIESALTNNSFTGGLLQTANGPVLSGTGGPAIIAGNFGSTSLIIAGQTAASLTLPTGASSIQRTDFVTGGSTSGQVAGYPETGWWYAPSTNQSFFLRNVSTNMRQPG